LIAFKLYSIDILSIFQPLLSSLCCVHSPTGSPWNYVLTNLLEPAHFYRYRTSCSSDGLAIPRLDSAELGDKKVKYKSWLSHSPGKGRAGLKFLKKIHQTDQLHQQVRTPSQCLPRYFLSRQDLSALHVKDGILKCSRYSSEREDRHHRRSSRNAFKDWQAGRDVHSRPDFSSLQLLRCDFEECWSERGACGGSPDGQLLHRHSS